MFLLLTIVIAILVISVCIISIDIKSRKSKHSKHIIVLLKKYSLRLQIIMLIVIAICDWALLEISNDLSLKTMLFGEKRTMQIVFLNICTISAILIIVWCIVKYMWLAGYIVSVIAMIFSVVNHYVIKYHGSPLSIYDFKNVTTAADVIGSYQISLDCCIIKLLIVYIICVAVCFITKLLFDEKSDNRLYGILLVCMCFIIYGYHSEKPVKPQYTIKWHWYPAYEEYGAAACMYEAFIQPLFNSPIIMPEGYSTEEIPDCEVSEIGCDTQQYPDIILILNETFFDLSQITDTKTNKDFLENIHHAANISKGYAVVPDIGGGTNRSEYELLTSNSLSIFNNITPFVNLELEERPSIVSYLQNIGYYTIGSHAASETNYNRDNGYTDIGFDEIHFIDDFEEEEYIYNRTSLNDSACYANMMKWMEDSVSEAPIFSYLLTIQNHGGWEMNTENQHSIKDSNDYGEYDSQVDEYLTCIQYSDNAWKQLIEHYDKSNRKVVICMLGDHSPSFASEIIKDEANMDMELRKVPLLIWDNFSGESKELGTMSVNYVVPTLLEYAGLPLTPYYQYLLDLKKKVPVLTSFGRYVATDGVVYSLDEKNEYSDAIQQYLYLEYHGITEDVQKIKKEWFYLLDLCD